MPGTKNTMRCTVENYRNAPLPICLFVPATALLVLCAFFDGTNLSAASLDFAGRTWNIKQSNTPVGPGPNHFSDSPNDVWSDQEGLHLTIQQTGGIWNSTEVILDESLGYGTYMFQTKTRQDILDANAVFGAFTWDSFGGSPIPNSPNREIDFEDSRFGNPLATTNSQFVVQPFDVAGNLQKVTLPDLSQDSNLTRFFTWSPGEVEFTALKGHYLPGSYPQSAVIQQFTYLDDGGNHRVPIPDRENFRFNLWLFESSSPASAAPVEVIVNDFQFFPLPPSNDELLFDFETGSQGWGSFGAITLASGELPTGGSEGQGRFHSGDFSQPDAGNFGIVDVSPAGLDLSSYVGLSVDALFRDVPGQPPFVGIKELDIIIETSSAEEFFAPKVTMTDDFGTFAVAFEDFQSGATSLPPTPTDLSDASIKLVVLNENGTGTAELIYDEIYGLHSINNADFDANAIVDGLDFLAWQTGFGKGNTHSQGDANSSRTVDSADRLLWESQYGTPGGNLLSSVTTVPEPSSLVIACTVLLSVIGPGACRQIF